MTPVHTRRRFLAAALAAPLAHALPSSRAHPLIIDAHVHVWKTDPRFPFAPGVHPSPANATAETLLGLMHANGVDRTVLIQVIHYRWDNSYLASVLRRYPRYFHGVCRVNPEDPLAPDQLTELTEVHGFRGVRLSPAAGSAGDWIRAPLMPLLWRRCAQLKVPMTILAPVSRLPDLVPLIEQNPDLTVVIDHMADCPLHHPDLLAHLLALANYPHVFVKISHLWSLSHDPYPYPDTHSQVAQLCSAFGADRLMWATDYPICLKQLPYARAVALFRDHLNFLTPADRHQILYRTAERVWPFPSRA